MTSSIAKKSWLSSPLVQVVASLSFIILALFVTNNLPIAHAAMIDINDNPQNIADATNEEGSIRALVRTIVNFFLFFLGMIAVIMVIYGGVLYVTAAGNDDQVGKAKNVIMYAVAGILVILISFALINTVLGAASGTEPAVESTTGNSNTI